MKRIMFLLGCSLFAVSGFAQETPAFNDKLAATVVASSGVSKSDVIINPNPVKGESFTIQLQNLQKGKYNIYIYDEQGKKYLVKALNISDGSVTESLQLPKKADKGVYILQVIGKTTRLSKKMIVE